MRPGEKVRCLALLDYKDGSTILAIQCQKDCRHGNAKKQTWISKFHRADILLPGEVKVRVRWNGEGVMTPEYRQYREALGLAQAWRHANRQKKGNTTWNGETPTHG